MQTGNSAAREFVESLAPGRRALAAMACLFVAFHLTCMVVRGAPSSLRDRLWPAFWWYADGLRMASSYGMFSVKSSDIAVVVRGIGADGRRRVLSHSSQRERTLSQRVVDVRLRKFQRHLIDPAERERFGQQYLRYFCRTAAANGTPLRRVELELVHPARGGRSSDQRTEVVLKRRCTKGEP